MVDEIPFHVPSFLVGIGFGIIIMIFIIFLTLHRIYVDIDKENPEDQFVE